MNRHTLLKAILLMFFICLLVFILKSKPLQTQQPPQDVGTTNDPVQPQIQPPSISEEPKKTEVLPQFTNYSEALKAAKEHNKNIFLYFEADWCGWCKKMKSEVLSDSEVKDKLNKNFIVCMINVDKDRQTARKFKASGVPTYLIVDKEESIIEKASGFKTKDKFLDWLEPKNVSTFKL